jgi:hypothetical protein
MDLAKPLRGDLVLVHVLPFVVVPMMMAEEYIPAATFDDRSDGGSATLEPARRSGEAGPHPRIESARGGRAGRRPDRADCEGRARRHHRDRHARAKRRPPVPAGQRGGAGRGDGIVFGTHGPGAVGPLTFRGGGHFTRIALFPFAIGSLPQTRVIVFLEAGDPKGILRSWDLRLERRPG